MTTQSEQELENNLIAQLQTIGWEKVRIDDEAALLANLKKQLEIHNKCTLADAEFKQVLNKLAKGNIFDKAKILRGKVDYIKDNGEVGYIELINQIQWCKNQYQVTNQVTMKGKYTVNVSYIISLLQNLQNAQPAEQEKQRKTIMNILDTEVQLRSKKELIERFITTNFPKIPKGGDISQEFETYWSEQKQQAIEELSKTEGLDLDGLQKVIGNYLFTEKTPMRDDVVGILKERPTLKERSTVSERIIGKIKDFVETFIDGVD